MNYNEFMLQNVHIISKPNEIRQKVLDEVELISSILHQGLPCLAQNGSSHKTINWSPAVVGRTVRGGLPGIVRRVVLDACKRSEALGPGSSDLVLRWTTSLVKEVLPQIISGQDSRGIEEMLQEAAGGFLNDNRLVANWLQENAFQQQIKQLPVHPKAAGMVWNAIKLAGMESRIFVDAESSDECIVELNRGFVFDVTPYEDMVGGSKKWIHSNVKVAIIDGMIETVSEIDKILTGANKDNAPVVIFARAFAEEVIGTLSVNFARKTLNVIPVRVPFDEFSANTIKDLSVVCDTPVVSSLTGDLISQIEFDNLGTVEKLTFEMGKTKIENLKGIMGAKHLSKELTERRQTAQSDALINLLDFRLRSLTSQSVRIRYDKAFYPHVQDLDLILRTSRAILSNGVVDLSAVQEITPKLFESSLKTVLNTTNNNILPTLTLLATIKHGTQAAISLLSINAALTIDGE